MAHPAERADTHNLVRARTTLGEFELIVCTDGHYFLDGGAMFGVVPKPLWSKRAPADEQNRILLGLNTVVVRTGKHTVAIEMGIGNKLPPKLKEIYGAQELLPQSMAAAGVKPDEVDVVINTHLHFDHSGGNTYRDGERIVPTFPRASYVFQTREWEDAIAPNERTRGSYLPDDYAPLEATGKLELIDESVEIIPGVRLDRVQGHTRGTQTVRVTDRNTTLFFSSDFMPDRHHLPLPWIPAFDLFPLDTLAAYGTGVQALGASIFEHELHQQPAKPAPLKIGADENRKLGVLRSEAGHIP